MVLLDMDTNGQRVEHFAEVATFFVWEHARGGLEHGAMLYVDWSSVHGDNPSAFAEVVNHSHGEHVRDGHHRQVGVTH